MQVSTACGIELTDKVLIYYGNVADEFLQMGIDGDGASVVGRHNELLKELGRTKKPILLKRGLAATVQEWIMSAEYIMSGGNHNVILCERGIRTYETYTRNTLDLSAVCAAKKLSHLPVIVDPSHAAGLWWMVPALAKAAVAVQVISTSASRTARIFFFMSAESGISP